MPAAAHPHVWIVARSEIVFDAEGKLIGFRHTWTFDPAYSAFAVTGLDSHRDGKPDPDKLAELAKTNVESLEEWGYFTAAMVNRPVSASTPRWSFLQDRRLWSGTARSSPSRPMTEPTSPSVCRYASRNTALNGVGPGSA